MNTVTILNGHVLDHLRELPENSVHCVITSPPYLGLRDYGVEGQIGLEKTIEEYVNKMVEVFREVHRVLRPDGVCFLNLGDSYNGSGGEHKDGGGQSGIGAKDRGRVGAGIGQKRLKTLKPKDLCGIPWRVALALQADGWWLRSDIIWAKPNPMPESVKDRPTRSHEYIFLLTKSAKYFWDQEAVKEPNLLISEKRVNYGLKHKHPDNIGVAIPPVNIDKMGERFCNPSGRNLRSVWNIATHPFSEAHFATFPPELVEKCIAAGTSEIGVCPKCGAPWGRIIERTGHINKREPAHAPKSCPTKVDSTGWGPTTKATNHWKPSCQCSISRRATPLWAGVGPNQICESIPRPISAIILDPFMGSGTTCLVAAKMQRDSIGIELKPEYVAMAKKRIKGELGFLVEII